MRQTKIQKKYFAYMATVAMFVVALGTWNFQNHQSSMVKSANTHNGLMTCASRISQTFTAWTLGSVGSSYLTVQFANISNDCLSQVNVALSSLAVNATKFKETMNRVLTDAHWFHEKVEASIDRKDARIINNAESRGDINDRYKSIDNNIEIMWTHFETAAIAAKESKKVWLNIALAATAMLLSLFAFYISTEFKVASLQAKLNARAKVLLLGGNFDEVARIDQVISESLLANNYNHVARLFHDHNENMIQHKSKQWMNDSEKEKTAEIANTPPVELMQTTLGSLVDRVYENISARVFGSGIMVDLQCDDDLAIEGKGEDIQQIIHSLFSMSLDKAEGSNEKKITLKIKGLGDTLLLKTTINTHCFNSDELEFFSAPNGTVTNVNMAIIKELMRDTQGEISLRNEFVDGDANATLEISLSNALIEDGPNNMSRKEVTSIIKGKKHEILARFRSARA
jgi:hypothetical protein